MRIRPVLVAAMLLLAGRAIADDADFLRDIKPLFAANCTKCHGPARQENGLRLDAGVAVLRGGDSGTPFVAGKPDESLLILAVTGKSDVISRMPPKGDPLSTAQIDLLKRWIAAGAKIPADDVAKTTGSRRWSCQAAGLQPVPT